MAKKDKHKLKIISLGGVEGIGKNITVFEYEDDIIIVDCGLAFPDEEMFGVDLVLPDMTYLFDNSDRIKGSGNPRPRRPHRATPFVKENSGSRLFHPFDPGNLRESWEHGY